MTNLTITMIVDETDQLVMKNDLLDIDEWAQNAVTGKGNNCWKRFQREWTTKLMEDPSFIDPIPSNKSEFVNLVTSRAEYKDRAERDAASKVE